MNLSVNSNLFIEKLCESLGLASEQVMKLLGEVVHGEKVSEIEEGEIISLSVRGIAHAKNSILRQKGIREMVQVPTANQIDLFDLRKLSRLNFGGDPQKDVPVEKYKFNSHPDLKSLYFRFHKAGSIDISDCRQLEDLDCSSNSIESLDTSNNLNLQRLNCQFNPLASLDLSHNHKLSYLQTNFTELTSDSLKFPNENNIAELHLRNTKIKEFHPEGFSQLSYWRLNGLEQEVFNTDNNKELLRISLSNSKIKTVIIKESPFLSEFDAKDSSFEEIICNEFQAFTIPFLTKQFKYETSTVV